MCGITRHRPDGMISPQHTGTGGPAFDFEFAGAPSVTPRDRWGF
jgi:hypothetical protein